MQTNFKIMCDGKLINKHSDGGEHYGWCNPIDFIPPIGSVIEYSTFDEPNYKSGEGVTTCYEVIGIKFTMREYYNSSYKNKVCIIEVKQIN